MRWACPAGTAGPARVTVAWGDKDRLLLSGRQSRRARERLPGATHVTIADAGHLAPWDDPRAVAGIVLAATATA